MKGKMILIAGTVSLAACNGSSAVAPTIDASARRSLDELAVVAPADLPEDKDRTKRVLPPCSPKGTKSNAFFAITDHAPPEVFAMLCLEKPIEKQSPDLARRIGGGRPGRSVRARPSATPRPGSPTQPR